MLILLRLYGEREFASLAIGFEWKIAEAIEPKRLASTLSWLSFALTIGESALYHASKRAQYSKFDNALTLTQAIPEKPFRDGGYVERMGLIASALEASLSHAPEKWLPRDDVVVIKGSIKDACNYLQQRPPLTKEEVRNWLNRAAERVRQKFPEESNSVGGYEQDSGGAEPGADNNDLGAQIILQWKDDALIFADSDSSTFFDVMEKLERDIESHCGELIAVDGHDFGSGTANIFVYTDHVRRAIDLLIKLADANKLPACVRIGTPDPFGTVRAHYPKDLRKFDLM